MNKTSIKLISVQFEFVKDKISVQDKIDASKKLGCHPATVYRYLSGQVAKEPFALELLTFLKKRVAEREKALID